MPIDPATLRKATEHVRRSDRVLAAIIRDVGPCGLQTDDRSGAFAALVESIVYQQITGKAAASIYGRVRKLFKRRHPRPHDILSATDEELRAVGLSRQKVAYLRDLAQRVSAGLSLRALGRLDVLPVHDYGIRKAMQRAYRFRKLPKPDRMRKVAEPWRPYRTVACWYLWRSLESKAGRA